MNYTNTNHQVVHIFAATRNAKNREPQMKKKVNTIINCERGNSSLTIYSFDPGPRDRIVVFANKEEQ